MECIVNIIHHACNLHRPNILIDEHGNGRIGDFGFSWELPQVVGGRTMFTFPRSEGYYPLELTHGQCGPRSDVYSLGIVSSFKK